MEKKADASSRSGRYRAQVLAQRDEIQNVLDHGYKWKVIWQALTDTGRIDMGYYTFMAHCRAIGLVKSPNSYDTSEKAASKKKPGRKGRRKSK